jgi:hypothetical protein
VRVEPLELGERDPTGLVAAIPAVSTRRGLRVCSSSGVMLGFLVRRPLRRGASIPPRVQTSHEFDDPHAALRFALLGPLPSSIAACFNTSLIFAISAASNFQIACLAFLPR